MRILILFLLLFSFPALANDKFAVIKNGEVVNIVVGRAKLDDSFLVIRSDIADIGDKYENGAIIKPPPEPEPAYVPNDAEILREALKAKVTQGEMDAARQRLLSSNQGAP